MELKMRITATFLGLILLAFFTVNVYGLPERPYRLYGTAYFNGVALTKTDTTYTITLKVNDVQLVSYKMGDKDTDYYLLVVPMDTDKDVPDAAFPGDTAYIYINGVAVDESPITIGNYGETVQKDIHASAIEANFTYSPSEPEEGASVTFTDASTPTGEITSWKWDFDYDGSTFDEDATVQHPKHTYTTDGTYTVALQVQHSSGVKSPIFTKEITVKNVAPTARIDAVQPDPPIQEGSTISFTGGSTDPGSDDQNPSYSWDFDASDGIQEDATGKTVQHQFTEDGAFTVTLTVTDSDGATGTDTSIVTVITQLVVDAGEDKTICHPNNGGEVQIGGNPTASGGTPPYNYSWEPAGSLNDASIANPTAKPTATTTYTATVTDSSTPKQQISDTVTVTVYLELIANAGDDKSINSGETVQIGGNPTASGGTLDYTYSWQPADTLDNPTSSNPNATPTETTTYTVTVTDAHGCVDTDDVTVTVEHGVVDIPDPNLEAVIRGIIGKPTGSITDTDLQGITSLDSEHDKDTPEDEKIADITGLEYCTNLQALELGFNQISNISALSGLTNLQELILLDNQISDISALSGLTNLQVLLLIDNQISNLQPLVDNSGLDEEDLVDMSGNPLNSASLNIHIPALEVRGVTVLFEPLPVYGDVTGNGRVTAYDAAVVLQACVGSITLTPEQEKMANVSGDGGITAFDAALILRYVVGLLTKFPVKDSAAAPYQTNHIYTLSVGEVYAKANERIIAPISIDNASGILSGTLLLTYDSTYLNPIDVSTTSLTAQSLTAYEAKDGVISISLANAQELRGKGAMLFIEFEGRKVSKAPVQLMLSDARLNEETNVRKVNGYIKFVPKMTALLSNFPNPFNPETWIPYRLNEPAKVVIRIYNVSGQLVRTLDIGPRQAGLYDDKVSAAYWDGRSGLGEQVSSGVYFYQLEAGKFSATRKMTIIR